MRTKTFYNIEEAALALGHGKHYFKDKADIARMDGGFHVVGDFQQRLMFVKERVDALALQVRAPRKVRKAKKVMLPIYKPEVKVGFL